jgi:hypothetical protein
MRKFGKRVDGVGGRRRIRRRPVSIQATGASLGDMARGLIIEDICFTGARVTGRNLPGEGTEILLRRGDRALLGEIVWAAADRRGILFSGARR